MKRVHVPIPHIVLFVLIALTSVVAPSVVMAQGPMSDDALQEQLLENERQFWVTFKARDAAGILRVSADDAIFVSPQGIDPMPQVIEAMPDYTVGEFALGPRAHLQRISDNAAVLVYDLEIGYPSPSLDYLMTAVYANRSGQWLAVSRSETRRGSPQPGGD